MGLLERIEETGKRHGLISRIGESGSVELVGPLGCLYESPVRSDAAGIRAWARTKADLGDLERRLVKSCALMVTARLDDRFALEGIVMPAVLGRAARILSGVGIRGRPVLAVRTRGRGPVRA